MRLSKLPLQRRAIACKDSKENHYVKTEIHPREFDKKIDYPIDEWK